MVSRRFRTGLRSLPHLLALSRPVLRQLSKSTNQSTLLADVDRLNSVFTYSNVVRRDDLKVRPLTHHHDIKWFTESTAIRDDLIASREVVRQLIEPVPIVR